jgi:hypothetical protein
MKNSITQEKVNTLYNYLLNEFSNKEFNYREIEEYLFNTEVHGMHFYYFVYAGVIDTLKRGVYKLNKSFYSTSAQAIYIKGKEHLANNRKNRLEKNTKENVLKLFNEPKENKFNEKSAILYLKNLGYKIMKPVQQYEEI